MATCKRRNLGLLPKEVSNRKRLNPRQFPPSCRHWLKSVAKKRRPRVAFTFGHLVVLGEFNAFVDDFYDFLEQLAKIKLVSMFLLFVVEFRVLHPKVWIETGKGKRYWQSLFLEIAAICGS